MRAKTVVPFLSVVVFSVLMFVSVVYAGMMPELAVNTFFDDMNATDVDEAVAMFAPEAIVINNLINRSYEGSDEIGELLQSWAHDGRRYEIVSKTVAGDSVSLTVEVSDRGMAWARIRMTAEVTDSLIQSLEVQDVRLMYWPMQTS